MTQQPHYEARCCTIPRLFMSGLTNHALRIGFSFLVACLRPSSVPIPHYTRPHGTHHLSTVSSRHTACAACKSTCALPISTEDDFRDAQNAVAHTAEAWNNLLASVASQPETAAELRRSTGQKMKQLDEELRVMTDALIHDD